MTALRCLPPVARRDARIVILGTMPGADSLRLQQYYANPGNAFWKIIAALFDIPADAPYAARCRQLTAHGIALWDVLAECNRQGSADSAIRNPKPNEFAAFYRQHRQLTRLFFAGTGAQHHYQTLITPAADFPTDCTRLPSPSGAFARKLEWKTAQWRVVREAVGG